MISKAKLAPLYLTLFLALAACSGDPVPDTTVGGTVDGDTPNIDDVYETTSTSNISFVPLLTLELYKDWSGFDGDNLFRTYFKSPFIKHYTINPVNATTLNSVSTAKITDFVITEDKVPLNPNVNFPMLQKIIGNQVTLVTAIVINTSSSMDGVDKTAFIAEIKDFVTASKANTSSALANQFFTVWAFDGLIVEETNGYKNTVADVHTALDTVLSKWQAGSYEGAGSNHTYDAVVQAVGRFAGDGPFSTTESFLDANSGDNNDLFDWVTPDFIRMSNVVLFSAGNGDTNAFNPEFFEKALQSQALLTYDPSTEGAGIDTELLTVGKPLIYVVPDGAFLDAGVENYAFSVIKNTISGGAYTFASSIVTAQSKALDTRLTLENQYAVRFASAIRQGDAHETVFKTKTPETSYGYSLTSKFDVSSNLPMPSASVEITGANDEYLAAGINNEGLDYAAAIAYFDVIQTFYPATRWTNEVFDSSHYTWTSSGTITHNANGSVTVESSNTFPITLTLTNTVIGDSFTVTINEKY